MARVKNKVIWLTGASSGIGEALAYELARRGARLILSARRKEELERVKGNCSVEAQANIHTLPLDLTQPATLQLSTQAAIQVFGHIDILINNAGMRQRSLIQETSLEMDRKMMEVNYFGTIAITKYLLPHFVQRKGGHFANISSVTGKFGTPYRSGYAATKHALHGFFDALRAEHWKDHVSVTMICPGFIRTNAYGKPSADENSPATKEEEFRARGKSPEWCAHKIVRAIERRKEEVYLGGREVMGVYIKRFFPSLFSRIIRKVSTR
ncbi:SDR family oxidoreductase [Chryseolinea lacunae]|uniref:SDR family oxidoreductase n=1 Tax=Chryseolinea lacunae TaxID=2801331 RepID=A0ABS1KUC3_9BACT|nr:SDR family oxidoreductase [Chryseolinea lacunae]MBL0742940.1 SDR family oxidoreductase [Chryseolinea lacunae]